MFHMRITDIVKSKGALGGIGLIVLGVYLVVHEKQYELGLGQIGAGLGILGIRDKQHAIDNPEQD